MPNALPFSIKVSNRFKNPDGRMQVPCTRILSPHYERKQITVDGWERPRASLQQAARLPLPPAFSPIWQPEVTFSAQRNPGSSVSGANNLLHVPKAVSSHARRYMHCTRSSEGKRNLLRDFTPKQLQRTLEASFPSVPRRAKR